MKKIVAMYSLFFASVVFAYDSRSLSDLSADCTLLVSAVASSSESIGWTSARLELMQDGVEKIDKLRQLTKMREDVASYKSQLLQNCIKH